MTLPRTAVDIGPDLVSPLFAGTDRHDRTIEALLSANINVTAPQRTYRAGGKRLEWTPEQYDRLQVFSGQIAKPQLDALTGSAVWKQLTEDQRDDEVAKIMKGARADAKAAVLSGAKPDDAGGQGVPTGGDPWAEFQDAR